jgi:polyferredoxin
MDITTEPSSPGRDHTYHCQPRRTSIAAAVLTAILILFLTGVGSASQVTVITSIAFALAGAAVTYTILRTGTDNRYRLLLFIFMGLAFTVAFTIEHEVHRGSILLTPNIVSNATTPICPIAIPFVAIPYAVTGKMAFPSTVAALVSILFLWFAMVLLFGRGWCSWICFFGWFDQFFASLAKKPLIRLDTIPDWAKLFPWALMLFLILVGVVALFPLYCAWLCPLRILYDPPQVVNTASWILALVFVIGGFIVFIAGPYLTKKRIYCSLVCPLMPANTIVGQASPFRVKIDAAVCTRCGACVRACEIFAIRQEPGQVPSPTIECMKCGKCMDACPAGAIDYRLAGTMTGARPWFVALAVVFCVLLAVGFVRTIIQFLLTGTVG